MPDSLEMPPATRDWDQAKADLARYGLAIVEDALTPRELTALRGRIVEQAVAERNTGVASLEHGGANQRIWNLINKGAIFAELLHKPLVRDAMSHILDGRFILSSYTANIAGRGGDEMMLHSDQGYVPLDIPIPPSRTSCGCSTISPRRTARRASYPVRTCRVAIQTRRTTAQLRGDRSRRQRARFRRTFMAWHRTKRHRSTAHGVLSYFARPFMRPQENCTLSVADDVLGVASPWLKELLGFRVWRSLGGVEGPFWPRTVDPATIERERWSDPSFDYVGTFVERPANPIREMKVDG
jgi:hypothetical protein